MSLDIQSRRRELLVLVVTAVALALLVNLLANVLFVSLYDRHKVIFTALVLLSTGIVSLGSYLSFLTQAEKSSLTIQFPLTFNRRDAKFEDLPRSPRGGHARVRLSHLPRERQLRLAAEDANWSWFFDGDFGKFVNDAVQEILLTLLLTRVRSPKIGWKSLVKEELPTE